MSFLGSTTGFLDTKAFRKDVLDKANSRLGVTVKAISEGGGVVNSKDLGLINLLDSTYKSDVPSTSYAMHLRAIAYESGRFLKTTEQVIEDLYFNTTKGEYLSQNIASFLFPNNRFAQSSYTDEKTRNLYLSIIKAYFGGSTLSNLEESLYTFLGVPVNLVENFLLTREDKTLDAVAKQFTFDIDVDTTDPRITDINLLQEEIEFLLDIIKPAHTSYQTKLIFSEFLDVFRKGCTSVLDVNGDPEITTDGFDIKIKQANTSICDTFHLDYFDYNYEDFRKSCGNVLVVSIEKEDVTIQAAPRCAQSIYGGTWQTSDPNIYHTKQGPFGKVNGNLADSVSDITVYINNTQATVLEIYPLSASFKLSETPSANDSVYVSYNYLKDYVSVLKTNDLDLVLNGNKNQATEFSYKCITWPTTYTTTQKTQYQEDYRYKGFDLFNSSVINNAESLNFNSLGLRNRLNDAQVFKSYEYDSGNYATRLNENTPIVPLSLNKKDNWNRLPYQEFRMNNTEFLLNVREDRMFGFLHYQKTPDFYASLEVESVNNGGEKKLISTICEDPTGGFFLNIAQKFEEDIPVLKEYDCFFYTNISKTNDTSCVLTNGAATWEISPSNNTYSYKLGGIIPQVCLLFSQIYTDTLIKCTEIYTKLWDINPAINPLTGMPLDKNSRWPIDLTIFNNEFYADPWIITNEGQSFPTGTEVLLHSKLKESDNALGYVTFSNTPSIFTMNSFLVSDQQLRNLQIENLIFESNNKRILNIISVTNVTKSQDYDLTNIQILNESVICLDNTLSQNISIGTTSGDVVKANYWGIDRTNDTNYLISIVGDSSNFIFQTEVEISSLIEVKNITRNEVYNLTGYSYLNKIIILDKTLMDNINIGIANTDIIYARYVVKEEKDLGESLLTYNLSKSTVTEITLSPV